MARNFQKIESNLSEEYGRRIGDTLTALFILSFIPILNTLFPGASYLLSILCTLIVPRIVSSGSKITSPSSFPIYMMV
ncbi:unnamed protein product [Caenorhabditis brenneri]